MNAFYEGKALASLQLQLSSHRLFGEPFVLEYDWEQSIGYWVCSTSHALRKVLSQELHKEGMTLRQWEVLAFLSVNKGCGAQAELREALGLEASTIAGVIDRMERDELLVRESCPDDKRKNTVSPTKKAKDFWERGAAVAHRIRAHAVGGISAEELEIFRKICERILENLSESFSPDPQ